MVTDGACGGRGDYIRICLVCILLLVLAFRLIIDLLCSISRLEAHDPAPSSGGSWEEGTRWLPKPKTDGGKRSEDALARD